MQTLTVEITNNNALKTLDRLVKKRYIRIAREAEIGSPALPGEPLSMRAFKNWITKAEKEQTVDLKEAKTRWASKKKQLLKLSK